MQLFAGTTPAELLLSYQLYFQKQSELNRSQQLPLQQKCLTVSWAALAGVFPAG